MLMISPSEVIMLGDIDLKENECIEYIATLEKKYPVEKWEIHGRKVWPLIRFRLFNLFMNQDNTIKPQIDKSLIFRLKYIMRTIFSLRYSYYGGKIPSKADVLILHDNMDRNIVLENGRCYDHNLDSILDFYESNNFKCISLEVINHLDNIKYPFYNESKCINFDLLKCKIMSRLKCKKIFVNMLEYDYFLKEIPLSQTLDISDIEKEVRQLNIICEYFKDIIRKKSIHVVVLQCWYGSLSMAAAMACHDLGIPCLDVQHGFAGAAGHRAYYGWSRFDDGYRYEVMPSHFWSWLPQDAEVILNWKCKDVQAVAAGKTIFLQNSYENLGSIYGYQLKDKIRKINKPCILVSLQTATVFPKWFREFIKEQTDNFIWLIRCHSCKDHVQLSFVEEIKDVKNVYTDDIDTINLDFLLQIVNIHITMWSSVVVDAYFCGVPSVVLSNQYFYNFQQIVSKKNVCYSNDKDSLLRNLTSMIVANKNKTKFSNELVGKEYLLSLAK